jgi:hypothetical protein
MILDENDAEGNRIQPCLWLRWIIGLNLQKKHHASMAVSKLRRDQ